MLPSQLPEIATTVAWDTETSGLHQDDGARVSVISVAWVGDDDQIEAHAFAFDQGERPDKRAQQTLTLEVDPNLPESEWHALCAWLTRRRLVAHNTKFDLHMTTTGTRHWPGVDLVDNAVWDTMLGCRELWPLEPTALKPTAERLSLLGGGERDDEAVLKQALKSGKKGKRYDLIAWETMEPYATRDAVLCLLLYLHQLELFEYGFALMPLMQREFAVMKGLYKIEQRGIGYDSVASLAAAKDLDVAQVELAKQLPFAPTINAAKRYFFGSKGHEGICPVPYAVTEKGSPQLNDVVLRRMISDKVLNADVYQRWRKIDVALSMWYEGYPAMVGQDGRLRTSYRQTKEEGQDGTGAVSGRFSVQRVNLQAIPHRSRLEGLPQGTPTPREFFQAKPGYELWEIDLRQAELRVAAKFARCERMLELIEQEADLHGVTATELFHIDDNDPDWFKYRQIAKRGNFSLIFGSGPDTFRAMLYKESGIDLSRQEGESVVEKWRALYPEFQRAIYRAQHAAESRGYVRLINGRRRYFFFGEQLHKAFNQAVQGSLAEFAKTWAILTERRYPGVLVLLIHDSEIVELEPGNEVVLKDLADVAARVSTKWFGVEIGADYGLWSQHS